MTRQLRVAVLSGLFLLCFLAMVGSTRAQSGPPDPTAVMDQMTNIPYFTLRDGMSSTLTVQNLATTPTKVTVTIFNTEGRAHVLDPITLDPHSFKEIQLADVAPQGFDSGNVAVAFNGTMMVVTCQVSVFSLEKRVSFESREADMMDFESANLAGILSLPKGADGFLAVTNVAKNRLTFQVTAGSLKKTVALYPRETELVKLNEDELAAPTLVRLQHNGMPGDLIATGYVLNLKDGYSSGFFMVDPGIMRSRTLAGAHFRAGRPDPSEGFPEGTRFHSPLLLGNVGTNPVTAHVSVDYTVREKVQMTPINPTDAEPTEDNFKKTVAVKDLTIAPGDVERVELADALVGVGQIAEAGVDVSYDAAPGSVIGQLTSVDQTGDYSFEVPVKDPDAMNEMRESAYPWTVENGTLTVLHVKNTTKETVEAGAVISFAGGVYQLDKLKLQPYQTVALDIQKLKDSKKPDALGRIFPAGATHGQLDWFQFTPYSMIGRAEDTDLAAGIARSFSCNADCCNNYSWYYTLSPSPMNGYLEGSSAFSATEYYTNCTGITNTYLNAQANATSWTSDYPSIATVNSGGGVTFVGQGSTLATGNFPTFYYQYAPPNYSTCTRYSFNDAATAVVNVEPPSHVEVLNDQQGLTTCPAGTTAVEVRQVHQQLVAVDNTPLTASNYWVGESFSSLSTNTCGNGAATPEGCLVTGPTFCAGCTTGEFSDTMSIVHSNTSNQFCSTINPTILAGNCGYSVTSSWSMCGDGLTNAVWTYNGVTKSVNVYVNGIYQYSHGTILH